MSVNQEPLSIDQMAIQLQNTRDHAANLARQVEQLEAQCAVMREALEGLLYVATSGTNGKPLTTPPKLNEIGWADAIQYAKFALSVNAGRDLLERVQKLERVAEAAREFLELENAPEATRIVTFACGCKCGWDDTELPPGTKCVECALKDALAALDGDQDD